MVYFLRGILFGLLHLVNPKLGRLVLHKCVPVILLLFKVPGKLWRGPGLDIFLCQIFLECLQLFGHLAQGSVLT